MSRLRLTVALVIAVLVTSSCSAFEPTDTLDTSAAVHAIEQAVQEDFGAGVESVSCPGDVEAAAGGRFECEATLDDGSVMHYTLRQLDAEGRLSLDPIEALVTADDIGRRVTAHFRGDRRSDATVDCGSAYVVTPPEEPVECTATEPDGTAHVITVTILDYDGTFNFTVDDEEVDDSTDTTAALPGG